MSPKFGIRVQGTVLQTGIEFGGSLQTGMSIPTTAATPAGVPLVTIDQTVFLNMTQLEIGAMAVLPVGASARANILAGLFFGFNISDSLELARVHRRRLHDRDIPDDVGLDFKTNNMSLGFGAEFKATERLFVGALYKFGLTNLDNLSDEPDAIFNSVKAERVPVLRPSSVRQLTNHRGARCYSTRSAPMSPTSAPTPLITSEAAPQITIRALHSTV